jgi:hypothetical protein
MSAIVQVECPECGRRSQIEYRRLGYPKVCESCNKEVSLRMAEVGEIPNTGRELTFGDFVRLLQAEGSRGIIAPLLKEEFEYRVVGNGNGARVFDTSKVPVDLLSLHIRIQEDEPMQRSLYQAAMSLWR